MRAGVILAGGRGERMQASRNKALLELAGRPIVAYSVDTFRACCDRLLLVSAEVDLALMRHLFPDVEVVPGGATRHGSEWNALQHLRDLDGEAVVAIHDAARPLVASADVQAVFAAAEKHGAAMLADPASLPGLESSPAGVVARAYPAGQLWRAQTPQAARLGLLLEAYGCAAGEGFTGTDTAAVLARYGSPVRVVPASGPNPKVTVPADLARAEELLRATRR